MSDKRQFADYYRPKLLTEVVGQDTAVKQIQGMLSKNRIPHTLVLSGPSGSGKTSISRILGNQIVNPKYVGKNNPDFHEITLGDERGIDAVRNIVAQAQFAPQHGRYVVFAIDEIAKATSQAFSPLLKTLEEPPKQTVFILITDEPERLPPTILNRCYRINLQPLTSLHIKKIVQRVMKLEKISFPSSKVLDYISNHAGEARTALQMLQAAHDAGGNDIKSILHNIRQFDPGNNNKLAVKILIGLYLNKPKLVFPSLLESLDVINLVNQLLRYNQWLMQNHFNDRVWQDKYTQLFKKHLNEGAGPPKLDRLSHTHNVLVNLRQLCPTISSFEQQHALLARLGSLVFSV